MSRFEISINDKKCRARTGQTILEVAEAHDIHIPTLCHHAKLSNTGACRMCIVEVEGQRRPVPSCTTPATPGMVARSDTPALWALRRQVVELLFSERNHICPFCTRSGHCELQDMGYLVGMTHVRYDYLHPTLPVDLTHPYIGLDHSRCILCGRCVRACDELAGVHTLDVRDRGGLAMIVADTGVPLGESTCISCGACVDVCPTGALFEKRTSHWRHDRELDRVSTVCPSCDVGCRIEVALQDGETIYDVRGDDAGPNRGNLCRHGRFGLAEPRAGRIDSPRIRRAGKLEPADADTAFAEVARRLGSGRVADDRSRVAGVISGRLPLETIAAFRRFMTDTIGADRVGLLDGPVHAAFREGLEGRFDGLALLEDLDRADLFVCIGADPTGLQGVVGEAIRRGIYHRRAGFVELSAQPTDLAELATHAFEVRAGGYEAVARSMLKGMTHYKAVRERLGADTVEAAAAVEDDGLEHQVGISAQATRMLAGLVAGARHPVIIVGADVAGEGAGAVRAVADLAVARGEDRSSGRVGLLPLAGSANAAVAGMLEMDRFDPAAFDAHTADVFFLVLGDDENQLPKAFVDELRAVPVTVLVAARERTVFGVADVVFPAPTWAERAGTFVNCERRVQKAAAVLDPPAGVISERECLEEIERRLGAGEPLDPATLLPDGVRDTGDGDVVAVGGRIHDLTVQVAVTQPGG